MTRLPVDVLGLRTLNLVLDPSLVVRQVLRRTGVGAPSVTINATAPTIVSASPMTFNSGFRFEDDDDVTLGSRRIPGYAKR